MSESYLRSSDIDSSSGIEMNRGAKIIVFGDQTSYSRTGLRALLRVKGDVLLTNFLDKVCSALSKEIDHLPGLRRETIIPFSDLHDLALHASNSTLCTALESALTCIIQFGWFIRYIL